MIHRDDDISLFVSCVDVAVSLGNVFQWIASIDDRLDCRRTHKFAKGGRYASGQENGEDMCQILSGNLGYILLLNIPESRHHTFTSHLPVNPNMKLAESASEVPSQARVVGVTFARILMED